MVSKYKGWFLVAIVSLVTVFLYYLSKPSGFDFFRFPLSTLNQILGLLGVSLLSLNFLLSTRIGFLEKYFGGLDKLYHFHHSLGATAFVLMVAHPLSLAVKALPDTTLAKNYLFYGSEFSYNLGILGLYSLILILLFTFIIRLPYHHWLTTHRLMGIPLLLIFAHTLFISSDISFYFPLRFWITALLLTALSSYIYKLFLYKFLGPKFRYTISAIKKMDSIIEIYLRPLKSSLKFQPGQFVFVNFPDLNHESHPFSISSSPDDPELRLSIKALGDYTSTLEQLKQGMATEVFGPYGQFYYSFLSSRPLVMIAGGIGITPFLGMLNFETGHQTLRPIRLYYSVKTPAEAVYLPELNSLAKKYSGIKIFPHFTTSQGYLTAGIVTRDIPDFDKMNYLLCGPKPFMASLSGQLQELGVKQSHIYYEDFSFNLN